MGRRCSRISCVCRSHCRWVVVGFSIFVCYFVYYYCSTTEIDKIPVHLYNSPKDAIGEDARGRHSSTLARRRGRGHLFELFGPIHGNATQAALSALRIHLLRKVSWEGGAVWAQEEASEGMWRVSYATECELSSLLLVHCSKESVKYKIKEDTKCDALLLLDFLERD